MTQKKHASKMRMVWVVFFCSLLHLTTSQSNTVVDPLVVQMGHACAC